ncbi:MAG: hypothetical protein HY710_15310, partial [Candidatus Latescibacteria bacterium]|nr:hypothetical protein [Candidatus Latescibacterota bacterium]
FKLTEWVHGDRMVFVLDSNYNGPHKPFLEKVIHPFRYASTATILPYENDEVDIEGVDVTDLQRVERDPRLKRELIRTPARSTWYLFFRTKQRPFNDIRVREAFARAIDREVICRVVLRGTAVPAYSMLPPGFKDYAGPSYKPVQGFGPARAKQLLRDAGYPNGRGFPKVEVWLRAPSPSIQLVGASIQGMLKEHLGIETTIRTADRTMYMDNLYNWRMNIGLVVFVADYVDPRNMLDMIWHSQPQGYGRHDWANLEFDRLVEAAASELNPARRSQFYRQAEAILVKDYGGAFVFHPESLELRKSWVKDTKLDRTGKVAVFDFTRVYVARH